MAASPKPIATRVASSSGRDKPAAIGVNMVKTDHQATATPMINLPPMRLASHPAGTWNSM